MANNYFRFKQFVVYQNNEVLKVSTDSCLLGATTPLLTQAKHILDMGCGTGLLTFMLYQKYPLAHFTAIDISPHAIQCIQHNYQVNQFNFNLDCICDNFLTFNTHLTFDIIICNPPFFINQLTSASKTKSTAKHAPTNFFYQLFLQIKKLLAAEAIACVLIDANSLHAVEKTLLQVKLIISHQIDIAHQIHYPIKRIILHVTHHNPAHKTTHETINIYQDDALNYSNAFKNYMASYYLNII